MSWFKQFMGLEAPSTKSRRNDPPASGQAPFGLASGRMLCLDPHLAALLDGESSLVVPDDEKVWAVGSIGVGQGKRLERFYLENDDYFLQVVMDGPKADDIEDIILFGYHEVRTVASKAELLRLVGPEAKIGMPFYELDGTEYSRQWGTEDGQTELTPMTERVISPDASYTVLHNSVLYARDTGLRNRREFLLFSAEEDEEGNVSLSTAVGLTLQITDITVL